MQEHTRTPSTRERVGGGLGNCCVCSLVGFCHLRGALVVQREVEGETENELLRKGERERKK